MLQLHGTCQQIDSCYGLFEVTLVNMKDPRSTYRVQITKEANKTSFGGPCCNELADTYEMEVGHNCVFYLENSYNTTYFWYRYQIGRAHV